MKNLNLETIEKDELLKINGGYSLADKLRMIANEITSSTPSWDEVKHLWNL